MAWIPLAAQAAGSVMSGIGGKNSQKAGQQAEQQDAQGVSQLFGTEGSAINNLMGLFSGQGGAGQQMPQLSQMLMGWLKNPMSDPAIGSLTTQLGNMGNSSVKTLQGDIGGVANPGAVAKQLFGQSEQNAQAGGAEAMQGLQGQNLGALGNIFGTESGLVGTGLQGLGNMANTYSQMGMNTQNMLSQQPNPFGSALSGLGSAAGGLWGPGGPWASSPTRRTVWRLTDAVGRRRWTRRHAATRWLPEPAADSVVRIAIASSFACCVGIWSRLQDEGNEVCVWRGSEKAGSPELLTSHRDVGKGIVALCDSWHALKAWAMEGARREPTLMLFDSSGLGAFADEARKAGLYVVGGGTFCDKLEKDRGFGANIAEAAGCKMPNVREFKSLDATIAFARGGGVTAPVYWKTDVYLDGDATHAADTGDELVEYLQWIQKRSRNHIYNVLEEKVDGIALSTARWWNGRAWVGPYEWTWERKKFMAGEIGPSTGCSLNAVGFHDDEVPAIASALKWDATTTAFLKNEAAPGLYDINAIAADGEAFFLEWTPRFGYDSEGTSLTHLYENLGRWLWYVATGQGDGSEPIMGDFALSVRLSVPPAPWEHGERDEKGSCVGVPVRGDTGDLWSEGFVGYELMRDADGLSVAAPEGLVGLAAARGDSLSDAWERCEEVIEGLRVPGLQWRNDVAEVIADDAQEALEEGFPTHAGLVVR